MASSRPPSSIQIHAGDQSVVIDADAEEQGLRVSGSREAILRVLPRAGAVAGDSAPAGETAS